MPQFTHLHVHTEYSILDGMSKISDLVDKCLRTGMNAMAITNSVDAFANTMYTMAHAHVCSSNYV